MRTRWSTRLDQIVSEAAEGKMFNCRRSLRMLAYWSIPLVVLVLFAPHVSAQSRHDLITSTLVASADRIGETLPFAWGSTPLPDHREFVDMPSPCEGQRVDLYWLQPTTNEQVSGGSIAIFDCGESRAGAALQSLQSSYFRTYNPGAKAESTTDYPFHGSSEHSTFFRGEIDASGCTVSLWEYHGFILVYLRPTRTISLGDVVDPNKKFVDFMEIMYQEATKSGLFESVDPGNLSPVIGSFDQNPQFPTTEDDVIFKIDAIDRSGGKLNYSWTLDGSKMPVTGNTARLPKPKAGDYEVRVVVTNSAGLTASRTKQVRVTQFVGIFDTDKDGVDDDRDLCPQEYSKNQDGCPVFDVTLDCLPKPPAPDQPLACTARVAGKHKDNTLELAWFLDSNQVQSSDALTWTWNPAQLGPHNILVRAMTQEQSDDASLDLDVGTAKPLTVNIGMLPDPPVPGKAVLFTAALDGYRPDENFTFEWTLDGQPLCKESSCTIEAPFGPHNVEVVVHGEGRDASTGLPFTVSAAVTDSSSIAEAGFAIDQLYCNDPISSDEQLVCNAHISRQRPDVDLLNVHWVIEGLAVEPVTSLDNSFTYSIPQPAPGRHSIGFRAVDLKSGKPQTQVISVTINPGANAAIPPITQAAAAGGTLTAVAAWWWVEWMLRKREARAHAEEERREASDDAAREHPSWMTDKRSLEEIEAQDAEAKPPQQDRSTRDDRESTQQALDDRWNKTRNDLLALWQAKDQDGDTFSRARTEQLIDFMDRHRDEAYHDGVWDPENFEELMDKLRRFGLAQSGADLGTSDSKLAIDEARQDARREAGAMWVGAMTGFLGGGAVLAAASSAAEAGTLGLIGFGGNVVAGAAGGYVEGGAKGALLGAVQAAAPVNTAISIWNGDPWWQVGLGLLQDWGNVADLKGITGGLARELTPGAGAARHELEPGKLPSLSKRVANGGERPGSSLRGGEMPTDPAARTAYIQKMLSDQGVRPEIWSKARYDVGDSRYGRYSPSEGGFVHDTSFKAGKVSVDTTAWHEAVVHKQQFDQLKTQAAPGGPKADFLTPDGKLTARGDRLLEADARADEIDRCIRKRDKVLRESGGVWTDEATALQKEVDDGRKAMDKVSRDALIDLRRKDIEHFSAERDRIVGENGGTMTPEATALQSKVMQAREQLDQLEAKGPRGRWVAGPPSEIGREAAPAYSVMEEVKSLKDRKKDLTELIVLEQRAEKAWQEHGVEKPGFWWGGGAASEETKQVEAINWELFLKEKDLADLRNKAGPSSSDLEKIASLESEVKEMAGRADELKKKIEDQVALFYRVPSADQVTDEMVPQHLFDSVRSKMGDQAYERMLALSGDPKVVPPGTKATEELARLEGKLDELRQRSATATIQH